MRHRMMWTMATVAAVATGTGGTAVSQQSTGAHAGHATSAASARAAVGYSAAIRHVTGPNDDRGTVVLVRPNGGIKTIGEVSDDAVIDDISSDASEIVTQRAQHGQARITVWNAKTRTPRYFRVKGGQEDVSVQFLGRSHQLLVSGPSGTTRRSTSGRVLHRYSTNNWRGGVVSAGGAYLAHSAKHGVKVVRVSNGAVVHSVPVPKGLTSCAPTRVWDTSSFAMSCAANRGVGDDRPYRAGFTAGVATMPLAPTSAGTVLNTSPVRVSQAHTGACQSPVGYYTGAKWHDLRLSKTDGTAPTLTGGAGSNIYLFQLSCSGRGGFLQRYNLKSKKFTNLAGTARTGKGMITDAVTVDS